MMANKHAGLLAEIEGDVLSDRPLADALRKCIALGGHAGSAALREWATKELRGYKQGEELPEYRTVPAPLFADLFTGNLHVTHQQISPSALPDVVRDDIKDEFPFHNGIGELEAMISEDGKTEVRLALPMAMDIAQLMNSESEHRFQQITSLYWGVSKSSLRGILDQVRTTLTELVAEMRAGMPVGQETPSAALAEHAVNVAVHGRKASVTLNTAQASGEGIASLGNLASAETDSPFWTRGKKIGAFIVGLTGVGAAVTAIAQAIW